MSSAVRLRFMMIVLALVLSGAATEVVQAADPAYPSRPVRLVVPFPPGGGVDVLARLLAPKLSEQMGQNWIVDNRSGAGGNVGAELVARANPDGYAVLMAVSSVLTVNPSLYKLPYSVENDLQPVVKLVSAENIVVVNPAVPATTLSEFVALAKEKPGVLNYGSSGVGSSIHLASALLAKRAGIELVHVAYKGAGPAVTALLAGETQMMVATVASTIAFVKAGRLRALASTGARRSKVMPDLPTVAESGYPGFEADAWYGLLVPAATPKSIAERIGTEARKAMQHAGLQAALASQGLAPETSTAAELSAQIKQETAMWASVIKDVGIRAE